MHYVEMYVPKDQGVQWEFGFCEQAPEQLVINLLTLASKIDISQIETGYLHDTNTNP